jgi:hypothetical protein
MAHAELVLPDEKSPARAFGIAAAILFIVAFLSPWKVLTAFVLIGLAATDWKFVFHGTTVVSMSLPGSRRNLFQITVALAFPLLLLWYFVKSTPAVTASAVIDQLADPLLLFPILVIGYVSWPAAAELDQQHPFRGFLIAFPVLFVEA